MERNKSLDCAKGIGIILVILAHIDVGSILNTWFYSFHLPIFYVIAGYCFNYTPDFWGFLKKRAKRCLIPYFVLGMAVVAVESVTGYLYARGFSTNLIFLLKQQRYSTLWFLATYFVALLIFYVIRLICGNRPKVVFLATLIISTISILFFSSHNYKLYWNIDTALCIQVYVGFGYLIKALGGIGPDEGTSTRKQIISIAVMALINIASCFGNLAISGGKVDMYWNSYGFLPLTLVSAVSGVMMVLYLTTLVTPRALCYVGKDSMIFFALHQSVIMIPLKMLFWSWDIKNGFLVKVLTFAGIMIICTLLDMIIRKLKLGIILGE